MQAPTAGPVGGHRTRWLCLYGLALGAIAFWLAGSALTDDGYITLDYARTLATDGTWGMTAGVSSNAATSPANVLILGALMWLAKLLTGQVHALFVLGTFIIAVMVATAAWWSVISKRLGISPLAAAAGLTIVLLSPLTLSAVGLETSMLVAVLTGMTAEAIRGRGVPFGLLAGLAVLTRLDLVVFVLVIGLGIGAIRRAWWKALLPLLVIALPWFITSWLVLGSAIPDTLAIKQQQVYSGYNWRFYGGPLLFLIHNTTPALVSFIPMLLGLIALIWWARQRTVRLRPLAVFAFAGVVYYLVYMAINPPPYLWYYVPSVAALGYFFSAALDPLAARLRAADPRPVVAAFAAVIFAGTFIPDVTHGLPWPYPPIFGNLASPADYMRIGNDLRTRVGDEGVISPGELGTLVYTCDCKILDQFSDRGRSIPFLRRQIDNAGPLTKWIYQLNYLHMDWNIKPAPYRYRLDIHEGWAPPHKDVWNNSSPALPRSHLVLMPKGVPVTPFAAKLDAPPPE